MYMGEMFEASPITTPPSMRNTMNSAKVRDRAVPMPVAKNSNPAKISRRLRPYLSLKPPARMAPSRQPTSAQLLAQPLAKAEVSWK